jgi:hypothetical protein
MLKERSADLARYVEPDRVRKEVYTDAEIFEREMERIHETVWIYCGDVEVTSRFHMLERRRDDIRHFAGSYLHKLKKSKKGYAIQPQRVDMTNGEAAYDYVLQVWV